MLMLHGWKCVVVPQDSQGSSVNSVLLDSPGRLLMVDPSPHVYLATAINMGPAILRQVGSVFVY